MYNFKSKAQNAGHIYSRKSSAPSAGPNEKHENSAGLCHASRAPCRLESELQCNIMVGLFSFGLNWPGTLQQWLWAYARVVWSVLNCMIQFAKTCRGLGWYSRPHVAEKAAPTEGALLAASCRPLCVCMRCAAPAGIASHRWPRSLKNAYAKTV